MPHAEGPTATGSGWALLPATVLGLAAVLLLVLRDPLLGTAALALGLLGAWWSDTTNRSDGLLPDLTAVASGIAILSLSDLAADLSDAGPERPPAVAARRPRISRIIARYCC